MSTIQAIIDQGIAAARQHGYADIEADVNGHNVVLSVEEAQHPKNHGAKVYRKNWKVDGKRVRAGQVCDCLADLVDVNH